VVKIPGVKNKKAKIKMSDGRSSGRSTGRVWRRSSPSGTWGKPKPTNNVVHIGVKKCSSGGSSFC